ncbi:MAG: triose-phosphate isomerase [Gammaproteobacteria bacterium]
MRQKLVVGNWKMHGSQQGVSDLIGALIPECDESLPGVEIAVCPTYLHIGEAARLLADSNITLGAQNAHAQAAGAYTGEVSVSMLREYGVEYVIVGHSERRTLFAETDEVVAEKFSAVQEHGMVPILCVGESLQEREAKETTGVVLRQLTAVIDRVGIKALQAAVIAYEPVWAIGTGKTATPEQAQQVHAVLRQQIAGLDAKIGEDIRIIYGGSVKAENAARLFAQADIDGALVGGASLLAGEFVSIFKSAVS